MSVVRLGRATLDGRPVSLIQLGGETCRPRDLPDAASLPREVPLDAIFRNWAEWRDRLASMRPRRPISDGDVVTVSVGGPGELRTRFVAQRRSALPAEKTA